MCLEAVHPPQKPSQAARLATGLVCILLASSCVDPQEIEQLKDNQAEIIATIARIEKKLDQRPTPKSHKAKKKAGRPDPEVVYGVPVLDSQQQGPKDAWVTMVVFTDLQCPYCARIHKTFKTLLERHPENLRLVFKHNPLSFHKQANAAALAAECAGSSGFWPAVDTMFSRQKELSSDKSMRKFVETGDLFGWDRCFESKAHQKKIDRDREMATKFGARGTPATFINGRFISGARPIAKFEALIEETLQKAKKSGVDRAIYYRVEIEQKGRRQK